MLKAAIEKIVSLAQPTTTTVDGKVYCNKDLKLVDTEKHHAQPICVSGLDSIVQLVKSEHVKTEEKIFVRVVSETRVQVFTSLDKDLDRDYLYECDADTPSIKLIGRFGASVEEAIVELRSLFVPTLDSQYLVDMLSSVSSGTKVTAKDDGVTQTVETQTGASLKQMAEIKSRVTLTPYRTFIEASSQPASEFIFRLEDGGKTVHLYPADGGVWRLEATRTIAEYFRQNLGDLIDEGKVVVIR